MSSILRCIISTFLFFHVFSLHAQVKQVHIGAIPAGDSIVFRHKVKIKHNISTPALVKNQFLILKQDGVDTIKSDDPKTQVPGDSTISVIYSYPQLFCSVSTIFLTEQTNTTMSVTPIDTAVEINSSLPLQKAVLVLTKAGTSSPDTLFFKPDSLLAKLYRQERSGDTLYIIPRVPFHHLSRTDWERAIKSVFFGNKSHRPINHTRSLTIWVEDSLLSSEPTIKKIELIPVNNLPDIKGDTSRLIYVEPMDASIHYYQQIDSSISISDPDSDTLAYVKVWIDNYRKGEDHLAVKDISTSDSLHIQFNSNKGELILQSKHFRPDADYWQRILRKLFYANSSNYPDTIIRTVSIKITDGGDTSPIYKRDIDISSTNDYPILKGDSSIIQFVEPLSDTIVASVVVDSTIIILDEDNNHFVSASINIKNFHAAQDTLCFVGDLPRYDSVDLHYNDSGSLIIAARYTGISKELMQNLLRSIAYRNYSRRPDTIPRRIDFYVFDGKDTSNLFEKTVIIHPVNDKPDIVASRKSIRFEIQPDKPYNQVKLDPLLQIKDIDDSLITKAIITIVDYKKGYDSLFLSGITLDDSVETYFDAQLGVYHISSLKKGIPIPVMQSLIRSLAYTHTGMYAVPGRRILQLKISDLSAESKPVSYEMDILVLNNKPNMLNLLQHAKTCIGKTISLDTMLRVYDQDIGQPLSFKIIRSRGQVTIANDTILTNGSIIKPVGITYQAKSAFKGVDTVMILAYDQFAISDTAKIIIQINDKPEIGAAIILGDSIVCLNDKTAYDYLLSGSDRFYISWSYTGQGAILSTVDTKAVMTFTNNSGSGMLTARLGNECGLSDPVEKYIHIRKTRTFPQKMIKGKDSVCTDEKNILFTIDETKGYQYNWYTTIPGSRLKPEGNKLWVDFGKQVKDGVIGVAITDSCGRTDTIAHSIIIVAAPDAKLKINAAKTDICVPDTTRFYVEANPKFQYKWQYSGKEVELLDSAQATWLICNNNSTDGYLSVEVANMCGIMKPSAIPITIHKKPARPETAVMDISVDAGQQNIPINIFKWADKNVYTCYYSGSGLKVIQQKPSLLLSFDDTAKSGILSVTAKNKCYTGEPLAINIEVVYPGLTLKYFSVQKIDKNVSGIFKTQKEQSVDRYEVYHSTDDTVYRKIADIEAGENSILVNDNDKVNLHPLDGGGVYTFLHKVPVPGYNYYKLKFRSTNGLQYNLDKQSLFIDTTVKMNRLILYPNPFGNIINIVCKDILPDDYQLRLYDLNGVIVFSKRVQIKPSDRIKEVVLSALLKKGNYHLVLESARNKFGSIIIKQ